MGPDPAAKKRPLRDALEPVASALTGHGHTLSAVREAIMAPFHADGLRPESIKMISDREFPRRPAGFTYVASDARLLHSGSAYDEPERARRKEWLRRADPRIV